MYKISECPCVLFLSLQHLNSSDVDPYCAEFEQIRVTHTLGRQAGIPDGERTWLNRRLLIHAPLTYVNSATSMLISSEEPEPPPPAYRQFTVHRCIHLMSACRIRRAAQSAAQRALSVSCSLLTVSASATTDDIHCSYRCDQSRDDLTSLPLHFHVLHLISQKSAWLPNFRSQAQEVTPGYTRLQCISRGIFGSTVYLDNWAYN